MINKFFVKGGSVVVKWLVILLSTFVLASCNQQESYETAELSLRSSNLIEKRGIPKVVKDEERLYTVESSMYSFVTVNDWFEKDTIIYLTDENGTSILYQLNILSGDNEIFFQIDDPIMSVDTNPDYSIFVIEVASLKGQKDLYFVDKNGYTLYKVTNIGEDYQLYWNHYKTSELTVAALKLDYSIELYNIDVKKRKISDFNFEHFYVQWLNENEIAYLKWDMYAPSYHAPIYTYNFKNNQEVKLADEIITFFSYQNYLLTVSVKDKYVTNSDYLFYDTHTKKVLARFKVPILNTYSEQWWIPNHAFDIKNETFYYFEPNNNDDLYEYSDGFTLVAYTISTGKKDKILTSDENYPMKLSPDGRWLLYGYQLEKVVDLNKKEINSLVYW